MRIFVGGITWEALTFSPVKATPDDYAYFYGKQIDQAYHVDVAAQELGFEPVYSVYAQCKMPGGWSSKQAYLNVKKQILDDIRAAGRLDGICLILHGANVADEGLGCVEEDLVLAVRQAVGADMLIAARYDQHANITVPQADALNIITILRTAPHRDTVTRYHDTLRLLVDAIRNKTKPVSTYIRIPMLIMGEKSTNVTEPMRSLIPLAVEASKREGILNADISVGYAWGDLEISGMGVAVTAASREHLPQSIALRDELARAVWARRNDFEICGEYAPDIDTAIRRALEAPERSVHMSDTGDNVTAGAPGDTTVFLKKLIEHGVKDAVVAGITDPENTRACFEAGLGATVTLKVGGKLDTVNADPLEVTGKVVNLHEYDPQAINDVRHATLDLGGILLVLTEQSWGFIKLKTFADAGIDPLEHKIVVTKVGYLHPEIVDVAPRGYMVITPGYSPLDLRTLEFKNVIRPIFPLDEFEWEPRQAA